MPEGKEKTLYISADAAGLIGECWIGEKRYRMHLPLPSDAPYPEMLRRLILSGNVTINQAQGTWEDITRQETFPAIIDASVEQDWPWKPSYGEKA